jgi:hypothetical protein
MKLRPVRARWIVVASLLATLVVRPGDSQFRRMAPGGLFLGEELWRSLINEYSGNVVLEHIRRLSQLHRIAGGSPGYHQAVEYVTGVLKSQGGCEVSVSKQISDGERKYLQWRSMPGWEVRKAELRLESTGEVLASYAEIPVTLFEYSNGANLSALAVFVGDGTSDSDYMGVDVAGKIVLATGAGDTVHREAVLKRGAAGVIVGPSDKDALCRMYPDLVRMHALRPNKSLREKTRFGFSLSRSWFERLLTAIRDDKNARLSVTIDARQYDSETETVSAFFKGSAFPDQEIILTAHLDHYRPGANDNASGSASLLEIARTLATLIDRGLIEKPRRSIRFLWLGEMHGFAGYLEQDAGIGKRGIAGINMDMVGEDVHKTFSIMTLIRPPYSNPSYIGDLVERMIDIIDNRSPYPSLGEGSRLHFRVLPFKGGSDHLLLSDPTIGVSCVNLGHDGDVFHHTSQDDLDKIDVAELKKLGIIALGAVLFTVNAGEAEAIAMALEVAEQGAMRLAERTKSHMAELGELFSRGSENAFGRLDDMLGYLDIQALTEIQAVRSVENLSKDLRIRTFVDRLASELNTTAEAEKARLNSYFKTLCALNGIAPHPIVASAEEKALDKIIPRRLFRGPISQFLFEDLVGDGMAWYAVYARTDPGWTDRRAEILNFMDGRRSLLQIFRAVSAELGRSDPEFYRRLVEDLKKHALVEY